MVIASGMLYTAQNGCKCMPSHLYGFLGLGPCGPEPTAEDFAGRRPVEKGPAFAAPLEPDAANDGSSWPTLRADAARSASSKAKLPAKLKEVWSVQVTPEQKGPLAAAWDSQLAPSLSPPVVAEGLVFVSARDQGQIVACEAATGKALWARQIAPGALRMNDILSMKDGQLAWRYMRLDKATGKTLSPASLPSLRDTSGGNGRLEGGLADGTYTMANNRRAGGAFDLGGKTYDLLAWNDRLAMAPKAVLSADGQKELGSVEIEGRPRVMGIALAENAAVYSLRSSDKAQLDARNTLKLVSLENGKTIQELPLRTQTTYDGLAIAGGKLFVSFHDGRLTCLGE
jgi:hypothetical protein